MGGTAPSEARRMPGEYQWAPGIRYAYNQVSIFRFVWLRWISRIARRPSRRFVLYRHVSAENPPAFRLFNAAVGTIYRPATRSFVRCA